MTGLKIIDDPVALSFFLTEALYAVKESAPAQPVQQGQPAPAPIQPGQQEEPGPTRADHPASSKVKEEPEVYHYLGENRRFVLVLVNYPDEKHVPEVEKTYLLKVLGAVKLGLDDVAILNYAHYPRRNFAELKAFFAFNYLLLFGVSPHSLQLPGPILPYHLGLVEGVKILAADSTETFRPDNARKKALWEELKKTFS